MGRMGMTILMLGIIAVWTGKSEMFTTVTGQQAIRCEYEIPGRKFWKSFKGVSCPARVEVE